MMAVSLNEQKTTHDREMNIRDFINENTIIILKEQHKGDILDALVIKAAGLGLVTDVPLFRAAIDAREAVCSTAVGDEIAIPHAKIPGIDAFFVMTAMVYPGVDWDAPDQKPVRIVFLIGGPDNDQKAYLGLLGKILKAVKNIDKKEWLFRSTRAAEVADILTR